MKVLKFLLMLVTITLLLASCVATKKVQPSKVVLLSTTDPKDLITLQANYFSKVPKVGSLQYTFENWYIVKEVK